MPNPTARRAGSNSVEITLIYPHQLFLPHPALAAGRLVLLIEDPLIFGNDPRWPLAVHRQKLVLHRASMTAYGDELRREGYQVTRIENPDGGETDSVELLDDHLPKKARVLHLADPADDVLSRRLQRLAVSRGMELIIHPSPNFLSPPEFLATHLAGGKRAFMARFYEAQRRRMNLLLEDDDTPMGGKWSFDAENREKLPKNHPVPPVPVAAAGSEVAEAIDYISRRFPGSPGSLAAFRWPVTRTAATAWLDDFIRERLDDFGRFEDAISIRHAFLNHSAITPMLNIGLLDPGDVIRRIVSHAANSGQVPMNSLEGFIRQVIGWREFMHGLYRHRGVEIRNGNFWNFTRPMPRGFYDGTTGIPPVDRVIRQVLAEGWCHHIERLMVLGNFMLLCRIRPDDVYRWFMELFVDAYDWVMVPNVYGMSQFADGGTFTTKPYLSGSNYIRKMSDEPAGDWCAVWDGLFWTFIGDHRGFFLKNPRLSMMVRQWDKQTPQKQAGHQAAAAAFLRSLDGVPGMG
jgi:deoxyribodipyrimidine photolyase-related protein